MSSFPSSGRPASEIIAELNDRRRQAGDLPWDSLKNLKASYDAGDDVTELAWNAFSLFRGDNLLYGGTLFQSLKNISSDVVEMVLRLLHAPPGAGGTVTTGGTESILLAVRAAFRKAREQRNLKGVPKIVAPYHAHAAFDKAASLMGGIVERTPLLDFRGNPAAIEQAIDSSTFMIAGSAPAYPLGHVDPIESLARLAQERDVWLHVDACVGGMFLPFAAASGHPVPDFDFALEGVSSMSVDLHKYGYSARGASLVLLRDEQLTDYFRFDFDSWPTGTFNTPTLTGSRASGAIASAWAVMNYLGFDGYRTRVDDILDAKSRLTKAIERVPGMAACGSPEAGIVGYTSKEKRVDMLAVRSALTEEGWHTAAVLQPRGLQVLLNHKHGRIVEPFAQAISQKVEACRVGKIQSHDTDLSYGS